MSEASYKVGDAVVQQFSDGFSRTVLVTERHADVKNGMPGFYGTACNAQGEPVEAYQDYPELWGYDYEVVRVLAGA